MTDAEVRDVVLLKLSKAQPGDVLVLYLDQEPDGDICRRLKKQLGDVTDRSPTVRVAIVSPHLRFELERAGDSRADAQPTAPSPRR